MNKYLFVYFSLAFKIFKFEFYDRNDKNSLKTSN